MNRQAQCFISGHILSLFLTLIVAGGSSVAFASSQPNDRLVVFDENPFDGTPRGFYEISPNGTSTFLTSVSPTSGRPLGFTYRPADGFVYAGSEDGRLWRINPVTGASESLGQLNAPYMAGLTTSPIDGTIYGAGPGPSLYKIDPATLTATPLGPRPFIEGGMAAAPNGLIYCLSDISPKVLMTINPTTFAVTTIGPINAAPISDITMTSGGRLFGVHWQGGTVYEINTLTGASSLIATLTNNSNGAVGIFSIPVPEPTAIGLAVIGIASAGLLRRKR